MQAQGSSRSRRVRCESIRHILSAELVETALIFRLQTGVEHLRESIAAEHEIASSGIEGSSRLGSDNCVERLTLLF
jgi:hypothetical protein